MPFRKKATFPSLSQLISILPGIFLLRIPFRTIPPVARKLPDKSPQNDLLYKLPLIRSRLRGGFL
jgi:hypothetical protein